MEKILKQRKIILACSSLGLLVFGIAYAFSMFTVPLSLAYNLQMSDIALTFNIIMICFILGAYASTFVLAKIGLRYTIIIGGSLYLIGFCSTSLFSYDSIFSVYIFYGCLTGVGYGFGYNTIIATTNAWFPDKIGFASGVQMMSVGFGSLFLGTAAANLIPTLGIQNVFIGIGVIAFLVVLGISFVIKQAPKDIQKLVKPRKNSGEKINYKNELPVKTPIYYLYSIWTVSILAIGVTVIGTVAYDAQSLGVSVAHATLLVGIVSLFNGYARIAIGVLYDKTGLKTVMTRNSALAITACAAAAIAFSTSAAFLYVIAALIAACSYGGCPVIASAFTNKRYGAKNFGRNLSIINFTVIAGSLLSMALLAVVGKGSNQKLLFVIFLGLAVVGLLSLIPFFKKLNHDVKMLR